MMIAAFLNWGFSNGSVFEGFGASQIHSCIYTLYLLRDSLWKFFLPADYQAMKVTEVAQPGKPRQIQAFELRMNIIADSTIDLLFTKNRVTLALTLLCFLLTLSLSLIHYFLPTPVIFIPSHCCLSCPCPCDSPCLNYSFMLGHYFRPFKCEILCRVFHTRTKYQH